MPILVIPYLGNRTYGADQEDSSAFSCVKIGLRGQPQVATIMGVGVGQKDGREQDLVPDQ
jgi:hypothetical protein